MNETEEAPFLLQPATGSELSLGLANTNNISAPSPRIGEDGALRGNEPPGVQEVGKGGKAFGHYRRKKTNKAPRKRTFIANMTKYNTMETGTLESAARGVGAGPSAGSHAISLFGLDHSQPGAITLGGEGGIDLSPESMLSGFPSHQPLQQVGGLLGTDTGAALDGVGSAASADLALLHPPHMALPPSLAELPLLGPPVAWGRKPAKGSGGTGTPPGAHHAATTFTELLNGPMNHMFNPQDLALQAQLLPQSFLTRPAAGGRARGATAQQQQSLMDSKSQESAAAAAIAMAVGGSVPASGHVQMMQRQAQQQQALAPPAVVQSHGLVGAPSGGFMGLAPAGPPKVSFDLFPELAALAGNDACAGATMQAMTGPVAPACVSRAVVTGMETVGRGPGALAMAPPQPLAATPRTPTSPTPTLTPQTSLQLRAGGNTLSSSGSTLPTSTTAAVGVLMPPGTEPAAPDVAATTTRPSPPPLGAPEPPSRSTSSCGTVGGATASHPMGALPVSVSALAGVTPALPLSAGSAPHRLSSSAGTIVAAASLGLGFGMHTLPPQTFASDSVASTSLHAPGTATAGVSSDPRVMATDGSAGTPLAAGPAESDAPLPSPFGMPLLPAPTLQQLQRLALVHVHHHQQQVPVGLLMPMTSADAPVPTTINSLIKHSVASNSASSLAAALAGALHLPPSSLLPPQQQQQPPLGGGRGRRGASGLGAGGGGTGPGRGGRGVKRGAAHLVAPAALAHAQQQQQQAAVAASDEHGALLAGSLAGVVGGSPRSQAPVPAQAGSQPRQPPLVLPMHGVSATGTVVPGGAGELRVSQLVSVGAYGLVYQGRWANREVAVKMMRQAREGEVLSATDILRSFRHEAQLLRQLAHPNIVALRHWQDVEPVCIVQDYATHGTLSDYLHGTSAPSSATPSSRALGGSMQASDLERAVLRRLARRLALSPDALIADLEARSIAAQLTLATPLSSSTSGSGIGELHVNQRVLRRYVVLLCLLRDVASALSYLAAPPAGLALPPIAHRDVKPTNILLSAQGMALLADFGVAKLCPHQPAAHAGAPPAAAMVPGAASGPPRLTTFSSAPALLGSLPQACLRHQAAHAAATAELQPDLAHMYTDWSEDLASLAVPAQQQQPQPCGAAAAPVPVPPGVPVQSQQLVGLKRARVATPSPAAHTLLGHSDSAPVLGSISIGEGVAAAVGADLQGWDPLPSSDMDLSWLDSLLVGDEHQQALLQQQQAQQEQESQQAAAATALAVPAATLVHVKPQPSENLAAAAADAQAKAAASGAPQPQQQHREGGQSCSWPLHHGTAHYAAPEDLCEDFKYLLTPAADMFSLGYCIWEALTGSKPWAGAASQDVAAAVGNSGARLPLPESWSPGMASLVGSCWSTDPSLRPTPGQVIAELDSEIRTALAGGV